MPVTNDSIAIANLVADSFSISNRSRSPVLDVISVVEVTEHVQEKASIEAEKEVDELWVVAVSEHHGEVVVEDDAELNLEITTENH